MDILWLRPDKPSNISVGRHRIAVELENRGHNVDVWNTTLKDFNSVLDTTPEVVVGTTRLGAFVGSWKKLASETPLVIDHIDPISQLRRTRDPVTTWGVDRLERMSFRIADHVMVVYDEELQRVQRYASSVTNTSLGVDFELFSNPPSPIIDSARDELSNRLPSGDNVLIYVGGLEPPYQLPTIVDAIALLDDWHFVVLGDGTQRTWLEECAQERTDIHYLGTVSYETVPGFLHAADAGISLVDDPHTLKVLEYGAAELPVVHAEGTAEEHLKGRVKFCSTDPSDIANTIRTATLINTEPLRRLSFQHRWSSITDTYETVFDQVSAE